jgi:biotin transport system substrate-specific component
MVARHRPSVRALTNWSAALAGLLLIVCGGLVQAAWPSYSEAGLNLIGLPMTLQVPALLLTALVCGPRSAMLAGVAYISIGLFELPVFQAGGGLAYLFSPGFGYIAGFLPAAWLSGRLAQRQDMDNLLGLTAAALVGLLMLQLLGIANLLLGSLMGRWQEALPQLLLSYSLGPLMPQILACCAVAVVALPLRRILLLPS